MALDDPDNAARKRWMGILAKARPEALCELLDGLGTRPGFHWLRGPETGGVMVRGRTGGTGAPFNLGEMTVTRCALQLESGEVGHAYVQGRDKAHAEAAALVDALMQTEQAEAIEAAVLRPLEDAHGARRAQRAARSAATRVDFFTMVRGED